MTEEQKGHLRRKARERLQELSGDVRYFTVDEIHKHFPKEKWIALAKLIAKS